MAARRVAVVGGGPAGLIAAEALAGAGAAVTVFDAMPSVGRKFLMAGRGGLNLTHGEPLEAFLGRYGVARDRLAPAIAAFPPAALIRWCEGLDQPTFVGSSGRVFPRALKASPLLRAWLTRLAARGVTIHTRRRWIGWGADGALTFAGPGGAVEIVATDATLLALGGASWPRLGADGAWTGLLAARGVDVADLAPANCGFDIGWSSVFRERFAGAPLKRIALSFAGRAVRGEAVVTTHGLEGGAVYALSGPLRDAIAAHGHATLRIDLRPDVDVGALESALARGRARRSLSTHLQKAARLAPAQIGLLRETAAGARIETLAPAALAALIKDLPLRLDAPRPIARAISSAGGVRWDAIDEAFMLKALPGVFVAGEMLDWEAPTGGYLLQACFATGLAAARGVAARLGLPAPAAPG